MPYRPYRSGVLSASGEYVEIPYRKKDFCNILTFISGGDVIIDAKFIGVGNNVKILFFAIVQQFFIRIVHRLIRAVMIDTYGTSFWEYHNIFHIFQLAEKQCLLRYIDLLKCAYMEQLRQSERISEGRL